ncbi:MAG: PP2C family protein-serine/threonine phosphatase, partial [Planctomycetota bacterium]
LDDGSLAIALADATGHGIGAALIMAETRALFRAAARQTRDPQRVVSEVNDLLCLDLPDGKFNTAFFGFLAPAEHTVRFLSAGQGPILVYVAATGDVRELETHGLPLGIMPEVEYDATTVFQPAPGDMLVLLTDGFYEWDRPDGEQFGTERIADLIRRHHALPAAEFIQVVYRAVVEFSAGTRQGDDLTAVIVRREPAG